jgi:hypothetical protein
MMEAPVHKYRVHKYSGCTLQLRRAAWHAVTAQLTVITVTVMIIKNNNQSL